MRDAVLARCEPPGASVARVAMEHGINANVIHSWRKRTRGGAVVHQVPVPEQFMPLALPAAIANPVAHVVEVEVQRGATLLKVRWPLQGAAGLGHWTREVLR